MNFGTVMECWCTVIALVTGVIAMALPLYAPETYSAERADRIARLNGNRDIFIAGWVNQISVPMPTNITG